MMQTGNSSGFSSLTIHKPTTKTTNSSSRNGNPTSTNQACAACKYQRKKCAPDCLLAPYFPHDRQKQFVNAHKLFGVSNITKLIKNLDPHMRDAAMNTIIFQSDAHANDPVGGCYRIIRELQHQIEYTKAELDLVLQHLALFREGSRLQIQESEDISSFSGSCDYNNSMPYDYLQMQGQQQPNYSILQEDMAILEIQDSSTMLNLKPGFTYEREDAQLMEEVSSGRQDPDEPNLTSSGLHQAFRVQSINPPLREENP